ncbi:MAG: GIY-YIG nuclease family protein [Luteimonas sp.]
MRPPKDPSLAAPSTIKWWSCPGVVYFLGVGSPTTAVKIGMLAVTENLNVQSAVARRVGHMQTSNHEPIEVLGLITFAECDYPTRAAEIKERELHLKYAHLARFRSGTKGAEWFNCSEALMDEILAVATPPESLGIPRCYASLAAPVEA